MENKNSGIKYKTKKRLKFRHIYALIMIAVTGYLAWEVLDLLVFTPRGATGLALGYRMEEITEFDDAWIEAVEAYGMSMDLIEEVSVFWNSGPVVYVIIHVEPGTNFGPARDQANILLEYFIEISDSDILQYDIQVVLTSGGDIEEKAAENQAAVVAHTHQFNYEFAERTLAWAERNPSENNVTRARDNINYSRLRPSIIEVVGEEGFEEMRRRAEAIVIEEPELDEDGVPLPSIYARPYPNPAQINQSRITEFPRWGTWDETRDRIRWSGRGSAD